MATGLDLAITHDDLVAHLLVLLIVVFCELAPLLRQYECFWNEVEILFGILLLHPPNVEA